MLAEHLPLRELQEALPESILKELTALVHRLDPNTPADPTSDRRFLAKLYESQIGPEKLARRTERRHLLEYAPEAILRDLATKLSLDSSVRFDQLADRISSLDWGANESTRIFLEHFGYPRNYLPEEQSIRAASEPISLLGPPLHTLRDYQASIFYRAQEALRPPCARLMIQMPTGSGKTRTAMELVSAFLNENKHRTVLWLAHSEELCEQAVESFLSVWRHIGTYSIDLHRCWGPYEPRSLSESNGIVFGGFKKLHSLMKRGVSSPSAALVVVDEAHMVLAPTFDAVVSWAQNLNGRIVGLSATPGRGTGGDEQTRELAAYFNERIINLESTHQGAIEALQSRGVLARVIREPLHTNITFSLTPDDWEHLEEQYDYSKEFLRRIAENHERNRIIAEKLLELAKQNLRTIVFAASIEQSKLLSALLLYKGIATAHIDGSTPQHTRRTAVTKFKRGETLFLLNYQVFSTGFDAPGIDAVVIARPTKSLVLYSQMVGRGLRGPAVGGTATVRLVDVIDNIVDYSGGLDSVYEYFNEYWA